MKKGFSVLLALALLLSLAGCTGKTEDTDYTTTLMVYMIGSDLEAKSGAGTDDLQEMAASGVDLSKVNVLVYAGGSPHWHNELADPEVHTLLRLTENGFEAITSTEAVSMGQAECLTNFLNYGYSNFPADRYGLILWDHGNGPVIGYGKDMLFENDCLTLQEMQQALDASPFGSENKLEWVGFDACLMASAELACLWSPYAKYLVASQEIEPSFGWNYSFLSQIGAVQTPQMLESLAQGYMDSCLAYFEDRGYDDRDTTLSCLDLSHADALCQAIDALFARAGADVATQYNQLTARRAQARSLGRASTGSEYDLIDLLDMAVWLGELYPQEVIALQQVLEDMVLTNATNAQGLCGLSLYYPFYNKAYYEKDWAAAYAQLGLFQQYQSYLKAYGEKWLQNDLLTEVADSAIPQQLDSQRYTLELTEAQNESFVSARYYILQQQGEEVFMPLFSSSNVTNEEGLLTASFDGDVLYARDDYGSYLIPVTMEHDTVGDITRYSVYVSLDNSLPLTATAPEGYEYQQQSHSFHLAVNTATKDISVSALMPYDYEMDTDQLTGGKIEDADLSQWTTYTFPNLRPMYLSRYDNGVIRSIWDWPTTAILSAYEMKIANGLDFVYAPLATGDYYLIFEITDTQGNQYCSELLPIHTEGEPEAAMGPDPIEVDWNKDQRLTLIEKNGVTVFVERVLDSYYETYNYGLGVTNSTSESVFLYADDLLVNGNIQVPSGSGGFLEVAAGETLVDEYGINWGTLEQIPDIITLDQFQLTIQVEETISGRILIYDQDVIVNLSKELVIDPAANLSDSYLYNKPLRQMLAQQQVVTEENGLRITLLDMGGNGTENSRLQANIKWENLTDEPINASIRGLVLDGVYVPAASGGTPIDPGNVIYSTLSVSADDLDHAGLNSIKDAKLVVRYDSGDSFAGLGNFSQLQRYPITLTHQGSGSTFPTGSKVLFNEKGIKITLLEYESSTYSNTWRVAVENNTDQDICLAMTETILNGTALPNDDYAGNTIYNGALGAHEKTIAEISFIDFDGYVLKSMAFKIRVMDFNEEKTLFVCNSQISLTVPKS